ncbi:MAG TPA: caspase domain-containing protein [Solimonas sp.]|nr:caspase domain-containing protein [Solimonas sp.]
MPTPTPAPAPQAQSHAPADELFGGGEVASPASAPPPGAAPPPPAAAEIALPSSGSSGKDLPTGEQRRIALIIGNSSYPMAPLKNAAADAELMRDTLSNLGFDVIAKTDVSQNEMRSAISDFGSRIKHGGVGLFYYAGHGLQIDGENYLIPVDARIENEGDVDTWGVNMETVLKQMGKAETHLNIVILDACRDNPFARGWRSVQKGLAELDAPTGTYVAYATAPGKTASDGDGGNGLYTQALSQAIRTPGLRLEDVFIATRRAVERRSGGLQTPWENGSLTGVFYFNGVGVPPPMAPLPLPMPERQVASAAPVVQEAAPSRELLELAVWSSVKNSTKKEDLDLYLGKFPKGTFAADARKRIAYLESPQALVDAMPLGVAMDIGGMPLLDSTVLHHFGEWTIVRGPGSRNVAVQAQGMSRTPVLNSPDDPENYYFYFGEGATTRAQLTMEDGDAEFQYQTADKNRALQGCKFSSRWSEIPPLKKLDNYKKTLAKARTVDVQDGFSVRVVTSEDEDQSVVLKREGEVLRVALADFTVSLDAGKPDVLVEDRRKKGGSCRYP